LALYHAYHHQEHVRDIMRHTSEETLKKMPEKAFPIHVREHKDTQTHLTV
jgi:hypothetical protein